METVGENFYKQNKAGHLKLKSEAEKPIKNSENGSKIDKSSSANKNVHHDHKTSSDKDKDAMDFFKTKNHSAKKKNNDNSKIEKIPDFQKSEYLKTAIEIIEKKNMSAESNKEPNQTKTDSDASKKPIEQADKNTTDKV